MASVSTSAKERRSKKAAGAKKPAPPSEPMKRGRKRKNGDDWQPGQDLPLSDSRKLSGEDVDVPKSPEQLGLEGIAETIDKEVDAAGRHLYDIQQARLKLTRKEHEAQAVLVNVMKNKGITAYRFGGLTVTIKSSDKAQVEVADKPDERTKDKSRD